MEGNPAGVGFWTRWFGFSLADSSLGEAQKKSGAGVGDSGERVRSYSTMRHGILLFLALMSELHIWE